MPGFEMYGPAAIFEIVYNLFERGTPAFLFAKNARAMLYQAELQAHEYDKYKK
jgi:hypothetical protein